MKEGCSKCVCVYTSCGQTSTVLNVQALLCHLALSIGSVETGFLTVALNSKSFFQVETFMFVLMYAKTYET